MDWQTILTIGALVFFAFMMMRGCGGMMGGGCGHSQAPKRRSPLQTQEETEPSSGSKSHN